MTTPTILSTPPDIIYPDCDGNSLSDNTKQLGWIITIVENLKLLYANHPDVFIAGDLLWYPIEGDNKTRQAPDIMVAIGALQGDRGSYQQWKENNIAPQVVFEILSPSNRLAEMSKKFRFYETYGVEEYYIYDPDRIDLAGYLRSGDHLEEIPEMDGWISPRLQIRFSMQPDLIIDRPDGTPFLTTIEMDQQRQQAELARQQAELSRQQAELARQQAERGRQQAESKAAEAIAQAKKLAAKLRELGIDPTDLSD